MTGLAHLGFVLNDYSHHLANTLREAGYETAVTGVQHLGPFAGKGEDFAAMGYERVLTPTWVSGPARAQAGVDYVKEKHSRPFFLSVGFNETHRPYPEVVDERDDASYTLPPAPLPDTPEVRRDMAAFKTLARRLDEAMGLVFAAVDAAGLAENTLIICTTDHGIAFPWMKCNLLDGGLGVMLIMRGPGAFSGGKVIDGMVSQVDLFPTLCELLGIEPPAWLQGVSFLPLVRGEAQEVRQELFAELNFHVSYEPVRCVRTPQWKYIRRFAPESGPLLLNCDRSPSKTFLVSNGWKEQGQVGEALYDLMLDPNEGNNLAGAAGSAQVLEEMRGRLDAWMKRTDDSLLHGPVPLPPEAARVRGLAVYMERGAIEKPEKRPKVKQT